MITILPQLRITNQGASSFIGVNTLTMGMTDCPAYMEARRQENIDLSGDHSYELMSISLHSQDSFDPDHPSPDHPGPPDHPNPPDQLEFSDSNYYCT